MNETILEFPCPVSYYEHLSDPQQMKLLHTGKTGALPQAGWVFMLDGTAYTATGVYINLGAGDLAVLLKPPGKPKSSEGEPKWYRRLFPSRSHSPALPG